MVNAPVADPPNILPRTHLAAGRLFEQQGMLARAIAQYRKAIAVNHDYPVAYHRLGLALSRANRHEPALAALRKAVALSPKDAVLHNDLGFELMYPNKWDEAESHFRKAIELNPGLTRAYVNLGLALSKQDRFDEALVAFKDVLPEADAHYNIGLMYRAHQRYKDAKEAFTHALAVAPEFNAARVQLDKLAARSDAEKEPALAQAKPKQKPPGPPKAAVDRAQKPPGAEVSAERAADASGTSEDTQGIVAATAIVEPAIQTPAPASERNVVPDPKPSEPGVVATVQVAGAEPAAIDALNGLDAATDEPADPDPVKDTEAPVDTAERGPPEDPWSAWRKRWNTLAEDLAWVRDEIACLDAVDVEYDPLADAGETYPSAWSSSSPTKPRLVSDPIETTEAQPASPGAGARRHERKFSSPKSEPISRVDILDHVFCELQDLVSLARNEIRFAEAGQEEQELVGPPAPTRETRTYGTEELVNLPPRPADLGPLPH